MSEHGPETGSEQEPHPTGAPGTPQGPPAPEHPVAGATTPFQPVPPPPAVPAGPHHPGAQWGWGQPQAYPGYGYPDAQPQEPTAQPQGMHPQTGQWAPHGGAPTAGLTAEQPSRRSGRLRIGVAGLVAGALIGGGAGAGVAALVDDPSTVTAPSASGQNVVIQNPQTATTATAAAAKAAPSVVTIYVANASSSGSGSGIILTSDGFVLTNNHVVTLDGSGSGAGTVQVRTANGTLYDASVVGTDPSSDLAVVRLNGASGLTPATFADSDKVQVGDFAVAIGAPLGLSNTVTDGIISATNRAVATGSTQNDATVIDALQTDAAINPGNSGGALVNGAGEVIGVNSAIATVASGTPSSQGQSGNIGVGFAIPGNSAQRIAKELMATGSAKRAFLGVTARTAAAGGNSGVGTGAEVASVQPGSAADAAGIKQGDVVTAVGDRPVTTSTELTAAVRSKGPGAKVALKVRRGNDTRTVQVTLGSSS